MAPSTNTSQETQDNTLYALRVVNDVNRVVQRAHPYMLPGFRALHGWTFAHWAFVSGLVMSRRRGDGTVAALDPELRQYGTKVAALMRTAFLLGYATALADVAGNQAEEDVNGNR